MSEDSLPVAEAAEAAGVDPADRKEFILSEAQWTAFWAMLDAAVARDMPKLRELMNEKAIWEEPDAEADDRKSAG